MFPQHHPQSWPSIPPSSPAWFALTVEPNRERTAERALRNHGFEAYLPMYRVRRHWSDRIKESDTVLFPGYVFCNFSYVDKLRVLQSAGVRSIVSSGREPVPVAAAEISALRALVASGRPILAWPYLPIGETVVIREGPLASLRGVILRAKNSWRAVVSVHALNCSVSVELDADMLSPEAASPSHRI